MIRLGLLLISALTICVVARAQPMLPSHAKLFTPILEIPGQYINDHSLIYAGDRWHLFAIQSPISSSWGHASSEVSIGHASSTDLIRWQTHDAALRVGAAGSLDAGHVYAPSVFESSGTYYMVYTGNQMSFNAGEHLFLATSTNLFDWKRASSAPMFVPDSSWATYYPAGYAGGHGGPRSFRDPFVFKPNTHLYGYICYYVARIKGDSSLKREDDDFSCVAAASSSDLVTWVDHGPVLARRTHGLDAYAWGHPESPCVVSYAGRYYLFYKSGSGTRYVISDNPLDFSDRTEYILSTSHASKVFVWNDEWYITSCSRDVDDVVHGKSDRTRGLFLARIEWIGAHPTVVGLK